MFKGGKGEQKGGKGVYGKGWWNHNPVGYGYQGYCYNCGEIGHKANECPVRVQGMEEEGIEEGAKEVGNVNVGGVWIVGAVDKVEEASSVVNRVERPNRWFHPNRFGGLTCEDDGDESEEEADEFPTLGVVKRGVNCSSECGCESHVGFQRVPRKKWKRVSFIEGDSAESEFEGVREEVVAICGVNESEPKQMKLGFQVAAVTKPLMAVRRITEQGNRVHFGPKEEDNYICSVASGDKLMLRDNGRGSYNMHVRFVNGEETTITVDSGAEESVCPPEWGRQFGLKPAGRWLNLRDAGGNLLHHYGEREVRVTSTF